MSERVICLWKRGSPVALLSWAAWSNRSRLLFCIEQRKRFALGHTKGEKCQKHIKNTHFSINLLVFCKRFARITSNSQESRANHSHRSVLKSNESNSRFKKWAILSQRAKGQIPNPGYLSSYNGLHERYGWICVDMIQTEFVLPFLWFYGLWRVEDPDLILIRVERSVLCHGKKESFTFLIIDVRVSSKYTLYTVEIKKNKKICTL